MNISNSSASFLKRLRANAHQDPARDWMTLLIFSTILLTGIIVWNVWAFDTVTKGGVIGSTPTGSSPVFNRSSLDAIRTLFAKRAVEEAKYEDGTYRYADPSQ